MHVICFFNVRTITFPVNPLLSVTFWGERKWTWLYAWPHKVTVQKLFNLIQLIKSPTRQQHVTMLLDCSHGINTAEIWTRWHLTQVHLFYWLCCCKFIFTYQTGSVNKDKNNFVITFEPVDCIQMLGIRANCSCWSWIQRMVGCPSTSVAQGPLAEVERPSQHSLQRRWLRGAALESHHLQHEVFQSLCHPEQSPFWSSTSATA